MDSFNLKKILLNVLWILISIIILVIVSDARKTHFTKFSGSSSDIACAAKYMDVQYGVVKISEVGTTCGYEPWSWFDTKITENENTYYIKDTESLTWNPPLHLPTLEPEPERQYLVPLPSPMSTGSKIELYFTPVIPFDWIFIDLEEENSTSENNICKLWIDGAKASMVMGSIRDDAWITYVTEDTSFPFIVETIYKVTIKATSTELQAFVDDALVLSIPHSQPATEIQRLRFFILNNSTVLLHRVDFLMNPSITLSL